ncbi:hypothetical protein EVAR_52464_1 [Eumeta japonica]|uniref:Uncharacterized protein n=1 Tax=Eumeta variegata TaxID=151549 RepID=A0A4C1Z4L3_EUMVA|nr:hypothetical protein EVAR_52464_1 [Eumeta japonica]
MLSARHSALSQSSNVTVLSDVLRAGVGSYPYDLKALVNFAISIMARADLFHEDAPVIVANFLYERPHFTLDGARTGSIRWDVVCARAAQGYVFSSQQYEYIPWEFPVICIGRNISRAVLDYYPGVGGENSYCMVDFVS